MIGDVPESREGGRVDASATGVHRILGFEMELLRRAAWEGNLGPEEDSRKSRPRRDAEV